jgi:hypothetical protein
MKRSEIRPQGRGWIWVDWALILLALAAIGGGIWLWRARSRAADPTLKIEYVIKITGISNDYATENGGWDALLPRGAQVTTANATAALGVVESVERRPHLEAGVRGGKLVFAECADRSDLYVTVRGDAASRIGDGIRISDVRIAAGGVGDFRIGSLYAPRAIIISVQRRNDE